MKSWVILKWLRNTDFVSGGKHIKGNQVGDISIWQTDDDHIWDSPAYEVLGYFDGSFRDAKKYAKEINLT
jgi:hypothetical protein